MRNAHTHGRAHKPSHVWVFISQEFVKNAVSLAMWRDGSSGGVIRTVTISKDGVEREMVSGAFQIFFDSSKGDVAFRV